MIIYQCQRFRRGNEGENGGYKSFEFCKYKEHGSDEEENEIFVDFLGRDYYSVKDYEVNEIGEF